MRTRNEILAERDSLLRDGNSILDLADAEGRNLTADEHRRYDEIVAKAESLNNELGVGKPSIPRSQPGDTSHMHDEIEGLGAPRRPAVTFNPGAKLKAFSNTAKGYEQAYVAGKWVQAVIHGDVNAIQWCQRKGLDVLAAHSGGNNAAGGALVPEPLERAIINLRDEYGMFRRVCRVVPMSSDTLYIPRRTGGLSAFFVGEGVEGEESDTSWDNVSLVAKKLMVLSRISSELNEDAIISVADFLAQECALAFAEKEDACGLNGDGTSTYGGIVGVLVKALDAAHTKAKVTASGSANSCDSLGEISGDHILELMAAVAPYAKKGARWYCSPAAMDLVFNAIKIAGGGNSLENLANAPSPVFLGYPIELTESMPSDPTADLSNLPMIAFGNLSMAATMGDRRGMRFRTSEERYWSEDQIGIKATQRFDINVHDLGSTTVKSPFAVLVGN